MVVQCSFWWIQLTFCLEELITFCIITKLCTFWYRTTFSVSVKPWKTHWLNCDILSLLYDLDYLQM